MICQRTTQAVIHVFTREGYTADVYLKDFYGAEKPSVSRAASERLKFQQLFDELGLQKDCVPSTRMVWVGILVDIVKMVFEVPADRVLRT